MDRPINKPKWSRNKIIYLSIGCIALIFILLAILGGRQSKINVDVSQIDIAEVKYENFHEFIPVDAMVYPKTTIYLDAVQGGIVEAIYCEDGSFLKKGDPILQLQNVSMELSYMDQETRMYDAINNLQNSRTEIEQGLIHRESELVDLNLRIGLLEKEYLRKKGFYAEKLISDKEFEDVDREYHYTLKKIQLALALKRLDSVSGIEQKKQISSSINRMNQNLGMLKKNIAGLVMKSPVEGQLSGFSVEIGETKIPGQRLGQIDMQDGYKMRASIDERYVSKVAKGQAAELEVDQITHKLVVDKIFTDVSNGVFQVDFEFESNAPASIKKGQTLAMRLNLGGGQEAMVIPRGAFFYDSGGQYIYVLDQSGSFATKRNIRIGRQNIYKYEITEGLEVGEKVLISSYASFGGKDKLLFKK